MNIKSSNGFHRNENQRSEFHQNETQRSEFHSMQEEAIRRVREMQRRSRSYVEADRRESEPSPPPKEETSGDSASDGKKDEPLFSLGGINIDEEKALIALMLYILYKNKADIKLMMGLGYLLL